MQAHQAVLLESSWAAQALPAEGAARAKAEALLSRAQVGARVRVLQPCLHKMARPGHDTAVHDMTWQLYTCHCPCGHGHVFSYICPHAVLHQGAPPPHPAVLCCAVPLGVQSVFLTSTSALRRKVQSGYQRQMANCLTALRMMHLLEDNTSGMRRGV